MELRWQMPRLEIPLPPAVIKRGFTSFQMVHAHTHTPCCSRVNKMKMNMKWKWQWGDKLPNRNARRGTQKKRGEKRRNTNTNTPSPQRTGEPWNGKEEKAGGRRAKHQPAEGGEDRSACHNLQGESHTYLSTRRAQTCLTREHETHEIWDPWGTRQWKGDTATTCHAEFVIRPKASRVLFQTP